MPRFTAQQLPKGWQALEGDLQRWRSSAQRPRSLDGVFVAGFHPDGGLKFYAFLEDGLDADGCALELEDGVEKGRACLDGVTEYYEDGAFFAVANGFEEGTPERRVCSFEDWVWRSLTAIGKSAAMDRERARRRADGRPLWRTSDGRFVD